MLGINDEHLPKFSGQFLMLAQIVDKLPHRQMLRHRDQVALHNPACGLFGIRQRGFNRGAVLRIEFLQNCLLLIRLQILDNGDRVIGVELAGQVRQLPGIQPLDYVLTHIIVGFGEHIGAHQIRQCVRQIAAILRRDKLHQVGDVGGVQRLGKAINLGIIAAFQRLGHAIDKIASQAVVLIQRRFHHHVFLLARIGPVGHGALLWLARGMRCNGPRRMPR